MRSRFYLQIISVSVAIILSFAAFPIPARPAEQASGQILGGTLDARVRIEVFSDFECPSCRELYLDVMRRVVVEYSSQNKVCVIYHEFPLNIHQYSREAARYAEAAAQLGREKLLMVYDALFMNQAQWGEDGKVEATVAKALPKADFLKVKKIMQDPSINASIEREIKLANQNRIMSTPTFFIYVGGKLQQKVEGRLTYVSLKQFIDSRVQ
jgi:protein-disulfide isomerase